MGSHSSDGHSGEAHDCQSCKDAYDDAISGIDRGDAAYKGSSSCFIATAVYGDVMAPEVVSLRQFRDDVLKKYWLGRLFISVYYATSPPVATWLKSKPKLAKFVRVQLDKIVNLIK